MIFLSFIIWGSESRTFFSMLKKMYSFKQSSYTFGGSVLKALDFLIAGLTQYAANRELK